MLSCWKRKKRSDYLWKRRALSLHRCSDHGSSETMAVNVDDIEESPGEKKRMMKLLLRCLSEEQQQALLHVVQENGGVFGDCICLSREVYLSKVHSTICPLLLTCQLWRWPDLVSTKDLLRLSHVCRGGTVEEDLLPRAAPATTAAPPEVTHHPTNLSDSALQCCNPYHWTRQVQGHEMFAPHKNDAKLQANLRPAGSYCAEEDNDKCLPEDSGRMSCIETETGMSRFRGGQPSADYSSTSLNQWSSYPGKHGEHKNPSFLFRRHHWCTVLYWEEKKMLGDPFRLVDSFLSISYPTPRPNEAGLSLKGLPTKDQTPKTAKLREGIGLGLVLILDETERNVYVYNRSGVPLFVSSRYLDLIHNHETQTKPIKVLSGYSIKAFDLDEKSMSLLAAATSPPSPGSEFESINVSFGKGWGPEYRRRDVLDCNCWVQVCLDNFKKR